MKRVLDIVIALLALLVASPLLLVVSVVIKLDSRGPVLFRQQRVGLQGKHFEIYKFRTMVDKADVAGPYYTREGDPRITTIGSLLRRSSIDELPQLLNVLFGNMSLVGPRPDLPRQEADYSSEQWRKRHTVRPGITGLAQARLRSDATHEQRTLLDLQYVDDASVWFDLKIMGLTLQQVLFRGGN